MASFALVQTKDRLVNQMQLNIAHVLDPLVGNLVTQGIILQKVALGSGTTVVQHKLGHILTGWFIVRQRSSATIYDNQDTNPTPTSTLVLVSSAAVNVDLYVF
jgi:hypothetical protein